MDEEIKFLREELAKFTPEDAEWAGIANELNFYEEYETEGE